MGLTIWNGHSDPFDEACPGPDDRLKLDQLDEPPRARPILETQILEPRLPTRFSPLQWIPVTVEGEEGDCLRLIPPFLIIRIQLNEVLLKAQVLVPWDSVVVDTDPFGTEGESRFVSEAVGGADDE
jgi:hypothetical protein